MRISSHLRISHCCNTAAAILHDASAPCHNIYPCNVQPLRHPSVHPPCRTTISNTVPRLEAAAQRGASAPADPVALRLAGASERLQRLLKLAEGLRSDTRSMALPGASSQVSGRRVFSDGTGEGCFKYHSAKKVKVS